MSRFSVRRWGRPRCSTDQDKTPVHDGGGGKGIGSSVGHARLRASNTRFKCRVVLSFLILFATVNAVVYLGSAGSLGFPLDDAWIHQTFARSLATTGQMAFNPGQPSAGDTSPAWVVILAVGYWLGLAPFAWSYFWGSVFAVLTGLVTWRLSIRYSGHRGFRWMIIPITALEWHLAWAALSGMETIFFTFLTVLYLWLDDRGTSPFYLGAVGALAAAVRPEGLLLSALYVLKLGVTTRRSPRQFFHSAIQYIFSLTILLAPIALFNLRYGSSPIPNTGLAKYMQWTYPWTVGKMTTFLVDVAVFFVLGPLMLLCPLVPIPMIRAWKDRSLRLFMPSLWIVGLIMLYAFTLPALYHNGRYLMPLIPVVIILGLDGLQTFSSQFRSISRFWNVYRVAVLAMILVTWLSNARSYSLELHLLEHSHLRIANWIQINTAPNAVIATHDIGILGYYGGRRIVDLAGLVTPDVIPLFHEPRSLAEYCRRNNVGYVIVFTDFYLDLLHDLNAQLVFSPDPDTVQQGLVPFEVFAVQN